MEGPKPVKGTTIVGVKAKEGVVLAADMQSTAYYVESKRERKIHKITENTAVATAGVVGDIQFLLRLIKAEAQLYEMENGKITPKAIATLLSTILHGNRIFPYITAMIVGGFDGKPELFAIDPFGGVGEGEDFYAMGSGSPVAIGVLEADYKPEMSIEEAKKLAVKAIKAAKERDVYTGGKGIIVAVIDAKGYREEVLE